VNDSTAPDLRTHGLYQQPTLDCDIVMKGGITSGVTYPWAVCEIARTYRLHSIGGTSAGAIAAAAAAAAELGREAPAGGFARLAELPDRLSAQLEGFEGPVLLNLFQAQDATRPVFALLLAALRNKGQRVRQILGIAATAIGGFPGAGVIGALPGLATLGLLLAAYATHRGLGPGGVGTLALILGVVAALVLTAIGLLVAVGWFGLGRTALRVLPQNGFGLCSGFAPGAPCPDGVDRGPDMQCDQAGSPVPKPLTTWLADELDGLAGKTDPAEPVTLGDLGSKGIRLQMFTTNLTTGTPYVIPFRTRIFFFHPNEFAGLFPPRVVDWMRQHGARPQDDRERALFEHMLPLLPLPEPANFPVVLAARLSLSFPILLSAIPMWAIDWTTGDQPQRCWFSDGGITSNFPIHFFDSPLPRWPTFGINLGPMEKSSDDERENIWAPNDNRSGIFPRWRTIETVPEFAHSILDTMQNWLDNAQSRVHGYRDRIVLIKHTAEEGGLNLNMPPPRIRRFSERGRLAGQLLAERFAQPWGPENRLAWDNHRWIRYRSSMWLLEQLLSKVRAGYEDGGQGPGASPYERMVRRDRDDPPGTSYWWCSNEQRAFAEEALEALVALAGLWTEETRSGSVPQSDRRSFECNAPRPAADLRITPGF
jgi:predicted acylesterase/phospholipase RssA